MLTFDCLYVEEYITQTDSREGKFNNVWNPAYLELSASH